jgi:membrane peptidoglycan carboxypeptidase
MLHRGFLPEAFRESIVKNYKERRFARGGSTISMQLVKNVFLSRDKTVSRKAEEALIVYLIENLRLVPKERMLEVYLNVIEWGPNVYGIGEASRFYFNKTPAELTLQESVFLAGIIPRPKYFKYQFDKDGKLKPYLDGYFRILTGRMAMKGWISPADTSGLLPDVKLKGPALRMVVPNDTIVLEPEEEL